MMQLRSRDGYVFLISVLSVGAMVTLIVSVLLIISTTLARSAMSLEQSSLALGYVDACMERALLNLRADQSYAGDETLTFDKGSCRILPLGGVGSLDRTVCAQGMSGEAVRRMEASIDTLFPQVSVASWDEVPGFTLCSE